jgi:hypothetical protein
VFQTHPEGTTTIALTIGDDPTHPVQAQRETLLNRQGRFDTITVVAITQADTEGQSAIPAHAQTQEHLFEIGPTVFAMPVSWPGSSYRCWLVLIRPIECNRGGVLMEPGRWDGVDLQRFEGNSAKDLVEIGGKQRIEDVAQAVIVECGLRQPRLE